jgi:hypothetical protein
MALKKSVVIDSIGVPADHHTVRQVTLDASAQSTIVAIDSYYSAATYRAGKSQIGYISITLNELPNAGEDAFAFAERALCASVPANPDPTQIPGSTNRYLFAGAKVV